MKRIVGFVTFCGALSTLCITSPALASDASDMAVACPKAKFETWVKERDRAACESKFKARRQDIRANPEKYIEEAIEAAERAERAAMEAEDAADRTH